MNFLKLVLTLFAILSGIVTYAQQEGAPANSPHSDDLEKHRKFIPYHHLRESDVFWEKRIWRIIDCNEKRNLPFVYPKEPLISQILSAVKEGLPIYSSINDEFSTPVSYDQIMEGLEGIDSAMGYNIELNIEEMMYFPIEFDPQTVRKYRIQEVWVFDEQTSTMYPRIMGIAPVRDIYDGNTGEKRGHSDMFWIYYPDAREYFDNLFAFNTGNDAIRPSWDDIFEMRLFSSYIIKESNIYDREIESYATAIDAVLESERIKKELFEMEHELWSY